MNVALMLKGMAMGIAEAIPGVSGGTIAFITGIYQELLSTIKSFTPSAIKQLFSAPRLFWQTVNGPFLLWLLIGMGAGLISGVFGISHLIEHHQILLWAFFLGLVLASAIYLALDVRWTLPNILLGILGAILTYWITQLLPAQGSTHPLYLIISGMLAISALMLPGLSGSFILLLLGLYQTVIGGVKGLLSGELDKLSLVVFFAVGALIGLFSFARILSYLFKRFPFATMATMIGVLLGSLSKLWPWKLISGVVNKKTGTFEEIAPIIAPDENLYKIAQEINVLPDKFDLIADSRVLAAVICFFCGLILVFLLSKYGKSEPK